ESPAGKARASAPKADLESHSPRVQPDTRRRGLKAERLFARFDRGSRGGGQALRQAKKRRGHLTGRSRYLFSEGCPAALGSAPTDLAAGRRNARWRPLGELNPCFKIENLAS